MRRYFVILLIVIFAVGLTALSLTNPAKPTNAGGLPCFFCHGMRAEGSDLAPRLAGTQLTDEQILKQIRSPRGVMPAFPEFAQPFIVEWIRQAPTGQPTMTLAPEWRSSALAMVAAAAAKRATDVLKSAGVKPTRTPTARPSVSPTPSPSATQLATLNTAYSNSSKTSDADESVTSLSRIIVVSGLLLVLFGGFWFVARRGKVKRLRDARGPAQDLLKEETSQK